MPSGGYRRKAGGKPSVDRVTVEVIRGIYRGIDQAREQRSLMEEKRRKLRAEIISLRAQILRLTSEWSQAGSSKLIETKKIYELRKQLKRHGLSAGILCDIKTHRGAYRDPSV